MQFAQQTSQKKRTRILLNLSSMIDIVFLLLLYFLVTMVITTPEDRLSSGLQARSEEASGQRSDFQPQVVEVAMIEGAAGYRMGSRIFRDAASLRTALDELQKDSGLFIQVGGGPLTGFVVAAFQAGHDAGFKQVTYVVPKQADGPGG
ncbi:MAG: biopolymer transporter ExbD [Phycisphaerales bacterium]